MAHFGIKRELTRVPSRTESGFSLIEILIALTIISIMSALAVFFLSGHQKLYHADNEALQIADVLQEARQRSLTQREGIRVQIDLTDNLVRLIDENQVGNDNDDVLIRSVPLLGPDAVNVKERSPQVTENPPEPFPVPSAQYSVSQYIMSQAHYVADIRFLSDGTIVNPDGVAGGGVTFHVWSPVKPGSSDFLVARALTIIGSSGSIRLWEYNQNLPGTNKWQDSRRTGVYGGQETSQPSPTP